MSVFKRIYLTTITLLLLLLTACSKAPQSIQVKKGASVATASESFIYGGKSFASNGTLDYEDAIRDRCSHFPQNSYRYQHNTNYRSGWIEASKKC